MKKKHSSKELDLEYIAKLIRDGYTSGYEPIWNLEITGNFDEFKYLDNDLKDIIEERISYVIEEGNENFIGVEVSIDVSNFSEEVIKSLGFDDEDIKETRGSDYTYLSFWINYKLNYKEIK